MNRDQKINPVMGHGGMRFSWSSPSSNWAKGAGADDSDSQWILSPYDTWELNPHYQGPDQRHPEEEPEDEDIMKTFS